MKSFKILCEGALENVIQNNPDIHADHIQILHSLLPNEDKSQRALEMLTRLYKNGKLQSHHLINNESNQESITNPIAILARANKRNLYSSINSLEELKNHSSQYTKYQESKRTKEETDSPIVFENDHIIVQQHKTQNACIKAAALHPQNPYYSGELNGKASWCISADSELGRTRHDNYTEKNTLPVYTVYNKHTHRKYMYVAEHRNMLQGGELRNEDQTNTPNRIHTTTIGEEHNKDGVYSLFPGLENSPIGKHIERYVDVRAQLHPITDDLINNAVMYNLTDEILSNHNFKKQHFTQLSARLIKEDDRHGINMFINKNIDHPFMGQDEFNLLATKGSVGRFNDKVFNSNLFTPSHAIETIKSGVLRNTPHTIDKIASYYPRVGEEHIMKHMVDAITNNYHKEQKEQKEGTIISNANMLFTSLAARGVIKPHHVQDILDSMKSNFNPRSEITRSIENYAKDNKNIALQQTLINNGYEYPLGYADLQQHFKDNFIENGNNEQLQVLTHNKHLNDSDISKLLTKHLSASSINRLLNHKNASPETITKYISSVTPSTREGIFKYEVPKLPVNELIKLKNQYPELHDHIVSSPHYPVDEQLKIIQHKSKGYGRIINESDNIDITNHIIEHLPDYAENINPDHLISNTRTYAQVNEILKHFEKGGKLHTKDNESNKKLGFELSHRILNKFEESSLFPRVFNNPLYDDETKLEAIKKSDVWPNNYTINKDGVESVNNSEFGKRNEVALRRIFSWRRIDGH